MNMIQSAKDQIAALTRSAYRAAVQEGLLPDGVETVPAVEIPKDTANGDYTTTFCLAASKAMRKNPREVANILTQHMKLDGTYFTSVEIAGPGFLNFRLGEKWYADVVEDVEREADAYGRGEGLKGKKYMVEFVSANPTGPMHMGNARGGVLGDTLANILRRDGCDTWKEFYVNDAGNQIVKLGESLTARYFEYFGKEYPLPEDGYHADDIKEIAAQLAKEEGDKWLTADPKERLAYFMDYGKKKELEKIDRDLKTYRVTMQSWMHETFFYEDNCKRINACLDRMADMGLTYEKDGALWFKSTDYGDEKDRVLRKSDGTFSYLTPDIANHVYKVERGYPLLVDLWGADHHSYVIRMQNALTALGYPKGTLEVDLIQMVRMVEDGKEVKMSKRTGNAITLRELCEDIGVDAARWFFVSKDVATHMDLDLKLARSKDNNNPVYYAQYAYSRMCSILRNPQIPEFKSVDVYERLTDEKEMQMLKLISEFPKEVAADALNRKPNKMTEYIITLVKVFHSYYNSTKVNNPDDPELTNERIGLIKAAMITLKNALTLIGVSAPESM